MNDKNDNLTPRQEVWVRAWISVSQAENCVDITSPGRWANRCLKDFNEAFPSQGESQSAEQ